MKPIPAICWNVPGDTLNGTFKAIAYRLSMGTMNGKHHFPFLERVMDVGTMYPNGGT